MPKTLSPGALRALSYVLFLYVVGLHVSIAVMEICAWGMAAFELVRFARARSFPAFPEWKPILGLFVCVAVGLLLHPGGRGFFFQLGFMRWALLLYFLSWILRELWSEEFERRLIYVWAAILTLTACYALFQTFTGIDLIRPSAHVISFERGVYRPVGFFSRSMAFAYAFGVSFLALSLPAWRTLPRLWGDALIFLGCATLLATEARGAWLGFLVAVSVYLLCVNWRWFVGFALAMTALIYGLSLTELEIGRKIHNMFAMNMDPSSFMRVHLWQAYFQMWKENPFFGVGLLQGDLLVPDYYRQLGIQEEFVSNAHNVYLQWLAGAGIFALGFYLWLIGCFLLKGWRLRSSTAWGWSIFIAQIFLHVGAFTENSFFTAITNHILIFTWSILIAWPPIDHRLGQG